MKQELVAAAAAFAVLAAGVPGPAQAGFTAPVRVAPMPVRIMPMPAPVRVAPPPAPIRVAPAPAPAPVRVAPAPVPVNNKPVNVAPAGQVPPVNKVASAGGGGAGKPPVSGKPSGAGGYNGNGRGGAGGGGNGSGSGPLGGRGYVPRHGASEYQVQSHNNWLLWYMLMNNSHNAQAHSYQAAPSGGSAAYVADAGYAVRSFVCEPGQGQLARDWVRQCERPAGRYQIEVRSACAPKAAETASGWVSRCGTRLGADW